MVNVVIADDDSDLVETISTLLDEKGIKVIGSASNGEEAAKKYSELKPDVLLLDLNMPNYDGHYAIEKIKQDYPNAKIIVISAYLDKLFQPSKVSAVFSKPYNIDEVLDKLKEITK